MINGIIELKDYKSEVLKICFDTMNERKRKFDNYYVYSLKHIKESIEYHVKHNLRYDIKSGKTYLDNEVWSEYSYKNDIPVYEDNELEYLLSDAFIGFILNGANRLNRGFKI